MSGATKRAQQPTKSAQQPSMLIISGSPRTHTSEALSAFIEQGAVAVGARVDQFFLSNKRIAPCTGCASCSTTGVCVLASIAGDDYLEFRSLIETTDALVVVAPLYFAGPSAQLKALFDRLQPYWAKRYVLGEDMRPKRPAQLFIVGGGGDAHGHAPLAGIARSALAVAGFDLEKVHNYVGFKAKEDTPVMPPEEERKNLALGELAYLRRAVAAQADFEQRANNAGGAFARYLGMIREKSVLQRELQKIESEIQTLRERDTKEIQTNEKAKGVFIEAAFAEFKADVSGSPGATGVSGAFGAAGASGAAAAQAAVAAAAAAVITANERDMDDLAAQASAKDVIADSVVPSQDTPAMGSTTGNAASSIVGDIADNATNSIAGSTAGDTA